jgi:hypothetical protein
MNFFKKTYYKLSLVVIYLLVNVTGFCEMTPNQLAQFVGVPGILQGRGYNATWQIKTPLSQAINMGGIGQITGIGGTPTNMSITWSPTYAALDTTVYRKRGHFFGSLGQNQWWEEAGLSMYVLKIPKSELYGFVRKVYRLPPYLRYGGGFTATASADIIMNTPQLDTQFFYSAAAQNTWYSNYWYAGMINTGDMFWRAYNGWERFRNPPNPSIVVSATSSPRFIAQPIGSILNITSGPSGVAQTIAFNADDNNYIYATYGVHHTNRRWSTKSRWGNVKNYHAEYYDAILLHLTDGKTGVIIEKQQENENTPPIIPAQSVIIDPTITWATAPNTTPKGGDTVTLSAKALAQPVLNITFTLLTGTGASITRDVIKTAQRGTGLTIKTNPDDTIEGTADYTFTAVKGQVYQIEATTTDGLKTSPAITYYTAVPDPIGNLEIYREELDENGLTTGNWIKTDGASTMWVPQKTNIKIVWSATDVQTANMKGPGFGGNTPENGENLVITNRNTSGTRIYTAPTAGFCQWFLTATAR